MNEINFELMRARLELIFRIIGKIFGREDFRAEAKKRFVQIITTDGVNLSFQHRYADKISFEESERKLNNEFIEIVVRHFNNIRKRIQETPPATIDITVANIEIHIRDGMDTLMIELKAFFEREENKEALAQLPTPNEKDNGEAS